MERLALGRTTFVITHRASALRPCDLVARIEHGQLVAMAPARAGAALETPEVALQGEAR
jgi:ABC-type transport system involved in cytochrome bd biosynthesis fused ATPase/permease subunit